MKLTISVERSAWGSFHGRVETDRKLRADMMPRDVLTMGINDNVGRGPARDNETRAAADAKRIARAIVARFDG